MSAPRQPGAAGPPGSGSALVGAARVGVILVGATLVATTAAFAQPARNGAGNAPRLEVELPTSELTIGDQFSVTLRLSGVDTEALSGPPRFPVWPGSGGGGRSWGAAEIFEVSAVRAIPSGSGGASTLADYEQTVRLAVFRTGLVFLPPPEVYLPYASATERLVPARDLGLEIVSLLETSDRAEASPPRPPRRLATPLEFWLVGGALSLACLLLATVQAGRSRRRRDAARPLSPRLQLERELENLSGETDAVRAIARLSLAVRGFLAQVLALPALESTTPEIAAALARSPRSVASGPPQHSAVVQLLTASDSVKFARGAATPQLIESGLRSARRLAVELDPERRHTEGTA